MRTIPTSFGTLKMVSLSKFIRTLQATKTTHEVMQFNTCVSSEVVGQVAGNGMPYSSDSHYKRNAILLRKDKGSEKLMDRFLMADLRKQAKKREFKGQVSFQGLADQLAYQYSYEYGKPEYLVHMGRRRWMVTNGSDFSVFVSDEGAALGCLFKGRTAIYKVRRK